MTGIRAKSVAWLLGLAVAASIGGAWAAGDAEVHIARQPWTFAGMRGHFDEGQLQRGFKVYVEVCARCHSIKRLHFRNLVQPGGPEFPEAAIKSLAGNNYKVDDVPDEPERSTSARPSWPTPSPGPSRTTRRRAMPPTAPCRPTCR